MTKQFTPLLNKEEAVEILFRTIFFHNKTTSHRNRQERLKLVSNSKKKLDTITNYYEQEEEDYDTVDGIDDNLKFIPKKVGSLS